MWLLRQRATLWLAVGIVAATVGASLAVVGGGETAWSDLWRVFGVPHVLAICAGFLWGLYSTLSRKLAGDESANAVPIFVLVIGLVLLCMYPLFRTDATWTPRAIFELVYSAFVPTFLAYIFWDLAVRKGDLTLVASLAYFTPLLSAVFSAIYLGVSLDAHLWAACGLIAGGAMICRASIRPHAER